ncbi:temptin-like [Mya arenaria]|uniref:temptin-like n=1 Tax=Mya arenaria TaxID=6604 RepID=UPI0022DF540F|nr:temptin-like [Mya arenaria]
MLRLAIISVVLTGALAHDYYRDRIPNGYSVPNPCGGGTWAPVGHFDPSHHTIQKNQFGLDFANAGHQWTAALCKMDSDGDGMSNGQELGDPNCVWTAGAAPSGAATGHPGICNPVTACGTYTCGCHGHNCVGK